MGFWLKISRSIDQLNEHIGRFVGWLTLAMVLIGTYNAITRYLGRYLGTDLSSNSYLELQWYFFSLVFLLGASYTWQRNSHVRVDLVYGRLPAKKKAWVDLLGTVLLMLPFVSVCLWLSWPSVRNSWAVREVSPDPGGLVRYPIKTVILVAFVLLILQGISQVVRQVAILRSEEPSEAKDTSTLEVHL